MPLEMNGKLTRNPANIIGWEKYRTFWKIHKTIFYYFVFLLPYLYEWNFGDAIK